MPRAEPWFFGLLQSKEDRYISGWTSLICLMWSRYVAGIIVSFPASTARMEKIPSISVISRHMRKSADGNTRHLKYGAGKHLGGQAEARTRDG